MFVSRNGLVIFATKVIILQVLLSLRIHLNAISLLAIISNKGTD